MPKYTHADVREVETKRIKLRDEAAEQRRIYDESEDPSTAVAQEAFTKLRKIEVDLDAAEAEVAEIRAQVAEADELRYRESRHRQFELEQRVGRLPEFLDMSDPNAPQPSLTGSIDPAEDAAYREAFWAMQKDQIPMQHRRNTFMTAEHREIMAEAEKRMITTGTASGDGGNTVPETFSASLTEFLKFSGPCVPNGGLCHDFSTESGDDYHVMTVNDTANSGAATPGESARTKKPYVDDMPVHNVNYIENAADPTFARVKFGATMYDSKFVPITYEMLMDTQIADLENLIARLLGKRLGRTINAAFTAKVIAAVPSANVITTATTLVLEPDEVLSLPHEIDPAYRGYMSTSGSVNSNISVMMTDATYKYLRLLKYPFSGTSSAGYTTQPYLINPSNDLLSGSADRLANMYGIRLNADMEGIVKSKHPIVMGDFSGFWIRSVRGIQIVTSSELYIQRLMIAMMAYQRCDAQMVDPNAFAAIKSK